MIGPASTPTPSQSFRSTRGEEPTPSKRYHARQIPVDTSKITEIWLDFGVSVFIKVVITNNLTVGTYASNTEYWYASPSVSVDDATSLDMGSQSGAYGTAQIASFVGSLDLAVMWTQVIGTGGWTAGTYTPTAYKARLYKATDPDDDRQQIGLLLEQDDENNLRSVTWYKQSNTGKIFDVTPEELTFTAVMNAENEPSVDPNDIENGTWYYANSDG
ncbi:hypothetical protein [Chondromyces crocatus]|uniref:Uncharacterized protein n=1 Tax=Chondromyces crocatus TaxID=52 RepID=A0A0K1ESL1_CHOCO|nr:hypothetical protein [Chondromyces crocatus]AKT43789.1 uncharacterized protein CMC5_080260 [Chondromyces crocatus]